MFPLVTLMCFLLCQFLFMLLFSWLCFPGYLLETSHVVQFYADGALICMILNDNHIHVPCYLHDTPWYMSKKNVELSGYQCFQQLNRMKTATAESQNDDKKHIFELSSQTACKYKHVA